MSSQLYSNLLSEIIKEKRRRNSKHETLNSCEINPYEIIFFNSISLDFGKFTGKTSYIADVLDVNKDIAFHLFQEIYTSQRSNSINTIFEIPQLISEGKIKIGKIFRFIYVDDSRAIFEENAQRYSKVHFINLMKPFIDNDTFFIFLG